jgi:O-antigen/teichoic acid export membrane protein
VVLQGVATLLALPFATRMLGPAEYGSVAVGLSIVQVGTVLAVAGLPLAITRAYFDPGDGPRRARAMVGLVVGVGVATVLTAALVRSVVGDVVALAVAAVGATALVIGTQAVLRAQGRPVVFVLTSMGVTTGAHVVGLLVAAGPRTATSYLAGYLAGAAVTAVVALCVTPPLLPWRVPGAAREGARIALPVLPHTAAVLVLNSGDPLILTRLAGAGEAGRYQVALMLGIAALAVLAGVNNAWSPAIMSAGDEERGAFLARTVRPVMAVAAVCTVGLALIAPAAVRVLAPPSFGHDEIGRLVQVIGLCALAQVPYLAASSLIFNRKRTTPLAFSTPVAAAVFVAAAVPLTGALGLMGTALAKVLGFVVLAAATMLVAARSDPVSWGARRWLPVAGLGVAGVALLQLVPTSGPAVWVQAALAVALGAAVVARLVRTGLPGRVDSGS